MVVFSENCDHSQSNPARLINDTFVCIQFWDMWVSAKCNDTLTVWQQHTTDCLVCYPVFLPEVSLPVVFCSFLFHDSLFSSEFIFTEQSACMKHPVASLSTLSYPQPVHPSRIIKKKKNVATHIQIIAIISEIALPQKAVIPSSKFYVPLIQLLSLI